MGEGSVRTSACTGDASGAQLGTSRSAFQVANWQCHLWVGPGTVPTAGRVTQALQGPAKCPLGLSSESEECTNLLPIGISLYVDILVISWT